MNAPIMLTVQHEPEIAAGSVDPIVNRKTKQIIGYKGRLPRSMSVPPKGCKNPSKFRQWVTPLCATRAEAIEILNAAVYELKTLGSLTKGRTFSDYAELDMAERLRKSLFRVDHPVAAEKRVQSWRNILKNWLPKASFWGWPPSAIRLEDLQGFVKWLETKARSRGRALSSGLIHNIVQQIRGILRAANVNPEATGKLKLPPRTKPKVPHMTLEQQRRFFAHPEIDRQDRVMAGIGMGIGVRVGELLALEAHQITLTGEGRGFIRLEHGGDHHSPLKGKGENKTRRIELHEPGLGFLKIWMADYYRGGVRVFEGPSGGYMSKWPEQWKKWSTLAGCRMHSHLMRHTYAVSMLSGSWGYEKRPLEFVKRQLGHTEIRTTEKYYADWAEGTWAKDVDDMVGSAVAKTPKPKPEILTAVAFLNGTRGPSSGLSGTPKPGKKPEKTAKSEGTRVDRWSTNDFPGNPEQNAEKAASDRPLCQAATVALAGRYSPRRRRRRGAVA